jgi:hypothetical protein
LKLLSKPRSESFYSVRAALCTGDSRMKNAATSTAINAGTEAIRKIFETLQPSATLELATKARPAHNR